MSNLNTVEKNPKSKIIIFLTTMPKESFEQFVERQEKKLDKAKKMVEEVKERWKDKIEEFEIEESVEKSVKELKKLWEENEKEVKKQPLGGIFFFISSLPLPEISLSLLEKTSNKFLKEFDWKKFEKKEYLASYLLGLFLSAFLKKNIENYILSQRKKGIKEKDIKPIEVHLKVKEAPIIFKELGFQNPKKLHLIIEGDCRHGTGERMQGGKIIVEGSCGCWTGSSMQGGEMIVKEDCENRAGWSMQGGKMIIEGNCRDWTGEHMQGGELNIKGEVESFDDRFTFSPDNKGTIIIRKGTEIWRDGNWTKEGKEMWERGEIPVK